MPCTAKSYTPEVEDAALHLSLLQAVTGETSHCSLCGVFSESLIHIVALSCHYCVIVVTMLGHCCDKLESLWSQYWSFRAKLSDFSASKIQLFFLEHRRGCFGAKLSDFLASKMQLFFLHFRAKLSDFSASNMQLFFLWIEKAALERNWAIFQPRTCGCFFLSGSKRLL